MRLAEENVTLLQLLVREENLRALIDAAFQETGAAHSARSHSAAECQARAALQRLVENDAATIRGKTEALVWQFTKPGEFHYACLVGHHFEDGMAGQINVVATGRSSKP